MTTTRHISTRQARREMVAEAVPVLIQRTGVTHYGVVDYTLCGVWIGEGAFGDYDVDCATCSRSYARAGWGCAACEQ